MPMDGTVSGLPTFPGLAYQAIRYEPLCGNLGTGSQYKEAKDWADTCIPAMESFGNNTELTLAFYDTTGIRLQGVRVGGGLDVCMCFAMAQVSGSFRAAVCQWVSGTGYGHDYYNSYRPNAEKSLPLCKDVNVDQMRAKWSATAVQPTVSERVSTVGTG